MNLIEYTMNLTRNNLLIPLFDILVANKGIFLVAFNNNFKNIFRLNIIVSYF